MKTRVLQYFTIMLGFLMTLTNETPLYLIVTMSQSTVVRACVHTRRGTKFSTKFSTTAVLNLVYLLVDLFIHSGFKLFF